MARPLFACFCGTTSLSDFPRPYITVLLPWDSRCGPHCHPVEARRGISQFLHKECPCMHGVYDRAGSEHASRWRRARCGLPLSSSTSAPRTEFGFAAQYPACTSPRTNASPLPLRTRAHGWGRCGSLSLHRTTLSFATPCQLTGALRGLEPGGEQHGPARGVTTEPRAGLETPEPRTTRSPADGCRPGFC